VVVYLCRRRRQLDGGPSAVKRAPAAVSSAHVPPAAAEYRPRAPASRGRCAVDAGIDEESETMLLASAASGGLYCAPPALHVPGTGSYLSSFQFNKLSCSYTINLPDALTLGGAYNGGGASRSRELLQWTADLQHGGGVGYSCRMQRSQHILTR